MIVYLHKLFCCLALLLLVLLPLVNQAAAVTAPDVTSLTSISTALSTPVRLANDSSGSLYVSDPRGGGIVQFASDGSYTKTIPVGGGILGVAVATNGDILVSQGVTVAVYSANGTSKTPFGTFGKANAIAVTTSGEIFVVDSLNNNVQAFNADYSARASFGGVGTTTGKFRQPTGIAYEKVSGQLAVTDTRNGRIQFFSTAGVFQKSIGTFGAGPLKFTSPQSVSFEYSADQATLKRIYVVDSFQSTIQIIDATTGEFVRYIGGYGITEGKLVTPSDILFDKNNRLVVANGTGKLSLFGVADSVKGPFLQIDAAPQVTNLSTLTISGTTTGASVTINGVPATVTGTTWSGSVVLTPGSNVITVVTTDATGSTTTRTVSVTALSPAADPVSLTVLPIAQQTSQSTMKLSGTVAEGGIVTVNGNAATIAGTNWSINVNLSPGVNTLKIVASKNGKDTSNVDLSVTLDTSTPVVATSLPSTGSVFSTPLQTISGTVSASNATTVLITLNGTTQAVPVSDGIFSIPVVLALGGNTISVAVIDSYGATTQALASSMVYDPQAPRITIATPAGAVSGTAIYRLEGTAPVGSSVTVNGTSATLTGTGWIADLQLVPGMNSFEVKATPTSGGATTTAMTSVAYSPGLPSLSITSPVKDSPVATDTNSITGIAPSGATVTALVNGVTTSVTTSASGSFVLAMPTFTAPGTYSVTVSVTDATGATSTSTRSIIYDPNPPVITINSATSPIKMTTTGVLIVKDKTGPVTGAVTYTGGVATLDLTGINYDPATLNIQALSPAGLSSRNGSFTAAAKPTIADALKALRISAKLDPVPPFAQLLTGDVAPLVNYESQPDGKIGFDDVVVILNKVLGLIP